ncbi:MAG: thiamine pyrophosphate-dependent enzyme [Candidatus Shikimatogenerans bostrichidophilus]|nr:MAG: thiamine pyrophosphate-dependent enzyme [Candidatus Shikimatogenerans bostrichidophilus]
MVLFKKKRDVLLKKIKWCLGCGNYSILYQLSKVLEDLKEKKERTIIVSGIGCSSRLPYFIKLNSIHSIHGRAFSIATGIILSNPKLNVWVITGDGDSFSIGLNHLLHTIRRNINIKILIVNNGVYALTKGQYSKTYYNSNNNNSFNIISLMLSAGATFIARTLDSNPIHIRKILKKANNHKGTSCIEIIQNCPIFNNIKDKINNILYLKNKYPLVYSKKKGIILIKNIPKIINYKNNKNIWIHNETDIYKSYILSNFFYINKNLPIPFGIFFRVKSKNKNKIKYKKQHQKLSCIFHKNFII